MLNVNDKDLLIRIKVILPTGNYFSLYNLFYILLCLFNSVLYVILLKLDA